jgi:hypothetical protein
MVYYFAHRFHPSAFLLYGQHYLRFVCVHYSKNFAYPQRKALYEENQVIRHTGKWAGKLALIQMIIPLRGLDRLGCLMADLTSVIYRAMRERDGELRVLKMKTKIQKIFNYDNDVDMHTIRIPAVYIKPTT